MVYPGLYKIRLKSYLFLVPTGNTDGLKRATADEKSHLFITLIMYFFLVQEWSLPHPLYLHHPVEKPVILLTTGIGIRDLILGKHTFCSYFPFKCPIDYWFVGVSRTKLPFDTTILRPMFILSNNFP